MRLQMDGSTGDLAYYRLVIEHTRTTELHFVRLHIFAHDVAFERWMAVPIETQPTVNRYEFRQMSATVCGWTQERRFFCSVVAEFWQRKMLISHHAYPTLTVSQSHLYAKSKNLIESTFWHPKNGSDLVTHMWIKQRVEIETHVRKSMPWVKKKRGKKTFSSFRWNDSTEMGIEKASASPLPLNPRPTPKMEQS